MPSPGKNTPRQKPERRSGPTHRHRRPPARAGPAALGLFVLEPCLLNSHVYARKKRPKCVVINTVRAETQPQSDRTHRTTRYQPASQPAGDVSKGGGAPAASLHSASEVTAACVGRGKHNDGWITDLQSHIIKRECDFRSFSYRYTKRNSSAFLSGLWFSLRHTVCHRKHLFPLTYEAELTKMLSVFLQGILLLLLDPFCSINYG